MPTHPQQLQRPRAAEQLTGIHRTWLTIACSVLGALWLAAMVLHCLYALNQHEDLLLRGTHRIFENLQERRPEPIESGYASPLLSHDRTYLVGIWLPKRLQELGFGSGTRIVELSKEQALARLLKHRFSDERGPHLPFFSMKRHVAFDHFDAEIMIPILKAPFFEGPAGPSVFSPPGFHPQPDDPPPFSSDVPSRPLELLRPLPDLEFTALVQVPLLPVLLPLFGWYGAVLLIGAVLLGSFGFSLRVVQRGVAQELLIAQAKANFTALVSHELKTPVAILRMYAEMLRDGLVNDPEKRKEFYRTMAFESLRLQHLIENLLDLGKVQSGSKSYRLQPEALEGIVREAIIRAESAFPTPQSEVLCSMETVPEVLADREVAVQAIANVVHNALKYGDGHPVEVSARLAEDGRTVAVSILDRGAGIPPEQKERIFEPYVRIGSEDTRTTQGTGLGLALVRAYMEGHGGSAIAGARPGGGSIFTLDFRVAVKGAGI